jgi:phage terminase large subunit-like protein
VLDNGERMVLEPFQQKMLADFFAGVRESVVCIAKGSGKTTLLGALALFELLTDRGCEGAVCAASRDQAQLLLGQLRGFVERTPGLASYVRLKQREAVNRRTGGRFRVLAADTDTMDGLLLTFGVADEAHRWKDSERYTILLAGVQKRNGRLFAISTAGVREQGLLWAMREKAIALGAEREGAYVGLRADRFVWHEWSVADDADVRDLAVVKAANPAPWITEDLLRERLESPAMTDFDWRRFSANQWTDRASEDGVITPDEWDALLDESGERPTGVLCFGVDVSLERDVASIAVAGYAGDKVLVQIVDSGMGVAWVPERLVKIVEANTSLPVIIDGIGPSGALIPRLQEWDIEVRETNAREFAQSLGVFLDLVKEDRLRHRGDPPLRHAVQGAATRPLSDSRAWSRKASLTDVSPLVASTLAAWGLCVLGPVRVGPFGGSNDPVTP